MRRVRLYTFANRFVLLGREVRRAVQAAVGDVRLGGWSVWVVASHSRNTGPRARSSSIASARSDDKGHHTVYSREQT